MKIYYGYSLEAPQGGASDEYPQRMFTWRNKNNINTFWLFVCFIWALSRFQQSFSHNATVSGCGREAGLSGSIGCASDWIPGGSGFDPHRG